MALYLYNQQTISSITDSVNKNLRESLLV